MWLDFSDEVDKGIWLDAYGEPVTWFKWISAAILAKVVNRALKIRTTFSSQQP